MTVVSLVSASAWFWLWPDGVRLARELARSMRRSLRAEWIVVGPALLLLAVEFLAGFRPPCRRRGRLPLGGTPPVGESRTLGHQSLPVHQRIQPGRDRLHDRGRVPSSTAAHWTDTMTLVVLASGTAALAQRFKALGALSTAAAIAIPAGTVEAHVSYNDIFAACLVLAGCVVVAGAPVTWALDVRRPAGRRDLGEADHGVPGSATGHPRPGCQAKAPGPVTSGYARRLVPVVVPVVVAAVGWFAYSLHYVHRLFQTGGLVLARFGHDPSHGLATLRPADPRPGAGRPVPPHRHRDHRSAGALGGRSSTRPRRVHPGDDRHHGEDRAAARRELGALAVPTVIAYLIASILVVRTRFLLVELLRRAAGRLDHRRVVEAAVPVAVPAPACTRHSASWSWPGSWTWSAHGVRLTTLTCRTQGPLRWPIPVPSPSARPNCSASATRAVRP